MNQQLHKQLRKDIQIQMLTKIQQVPILARDKQQQLLPLQPLYKEANMGKVKVLLLQIQHLKYTEETKEMYNLLLKLEHLKVTLVIDINLRGPKRLLAISQKQDLLNQVHLKEKQLIEENQLKIFKLHILFILLDRLNFI